MPRTRANSSASQTIPPYLKAIESDVPSKSDPLETIKSNDSLSASELQPKKRRPQAARYGSRNLATGLSHSTNTNTGDALPKSRQKTYAPGFQPHPKVVPEHEDDEHLSPSVVLQQAADKLAALETSRERTAGDSGNVAASGYASEDMDALLDRKEESEGDESEWGEVSDSNRGADDYSQGYEGDFESALMSRNSTNATRDVLQHEIKKITEAESKVSRHASMALSEAQRSRANLSSADAEKRSRSSTASARAERKAEQQPVRRRSCSINNVIPNISAFGVEFRKYPKLQSIVPKLMEERHAEAAYVNRSIMLRLANPWSEVKNTDLIMSYLSMPTGKKDGKARPMHPFLRTAGNKPKRPSSAPPSRTTDLSKSEFFNRLAQPRHMEPFDPYPDGFTPHPRRTSNRPVSGERLQSLSSPRSPKVEQEEIVKSIHGGPKRLDPAIWDRLSQPRIVIVKKSKEEKPPSAPVRKRTVRKKETRSQAGDGVRRPPRPGSARGLPKAPVLVGKYGRMASKSSSASSLATVDDKDANPAESIDTSSIFEADEGGVSHSSGQPRTSMSIGHSRYDSIAEEGEQGSETNGDVSGNQTAHKNGHQGEEIALPPSPSTSTNNLAGSRMASAPKLATSQALADKPAKSQTNDITAEDAARQPLPVSAAASVDNLTKSGSMGASRPDIVKSSQNLISKSQQSLRSSSNISGSRLLEHALQQPLPQSAQNSRTELRRLQDGRSSRLSMGDMAVDYRKSDTAEGQIKANSGKAISIDDEADNALERALNAPLPASTPQSRLQSENSLARSRSKEILGNSATSSSRNDIRPASRTNSQNLSKKYDESLKLSRKNSQHDLGPELALPNSGSRMGSKADLMAREK